MANTQRKKKLFVNWFWLKVMLSYQLYSNELDSVD